MALIWHPQYPSFSVPSNTAIGLREDDLGFARGAFGYSHPFATLAAFLRPFLSQANTAHPGSFFLGKNCRVEVSEFFTYGQNLPIGKICPVEFSAYRQNLPHLTLGKLG